jgi:UDP-N-acetylglucosamine 2-epimerase (non-hydrolysing)
MAPVVSALRRESAVETRVVLTGQHTALVDQALEVFGLVPEYDLGIMREGQTLYDVAHACLDGLRGVVEDFRPRAMLVQGDTATVCFGALVGFFEDVRVGHVEAGLRSGRKRAPFPEEMFRRMVDALADWHFAPTGQAVDNLRREGIESDSIHLTGNTVVDALSRAADASKAPSHPLLVDALAGDRRLVLLTAHRRESFGEPLRRVFRAVRELADSRADVFVVYPVHPNPQVRGPANEILSGHPRIRLTEPLNYLDFVLALREAALVLTDSGGVQEEASSFGNPVLVLRDVTDRPESVAAHTAEVVGTDDHRILSRALALLDRSAARRIDRASPFGDGQAGDRIADIVVSDLTGRTRRTTDWAGS